MLTDVESQHAKQKCIQCFTKGSVLECVNTLRTVIKREEDQEMLALYCGDKHVLSPGYKNWFTTKWHSWPAERKLKYLHDFQSAKPSLESTFLKPANPGQKPGYRRRS